MAHRVQVERYFVVMMLPAMIGAIRIQLAPVRCFDAGAPGANLDARWHALTINDAEAPSKR